MKRRILCIVLAMLMLNIPGAVIGVSAETGTAAADGGKAALRGTENGGNPPG